MLDSQTAGQAHTDLLKWMSIKAFVAFVSMDWRSIKDAKDGESWNLARKAYRIIVVQSFAQCYLLPTSTPYLLLCSTMHLLT